jgi:hypothetical protein
VRHPNVVSNNNKKFEAKYTEISTMDNVK